jgi:hypothetical protein
MRTVGRRKQHPISFSASAERLTEGARFIDEMHKLPGGNASFIPKGVYHFKTHDEANRHAEACLAEGMARLAMERAQWKNTAAPRRSKT